MTSWNKCQSMDEVLMEKDTLDLLKHAVKQAYPKEACGILMSRITNPVNENTSVIKEIIPMVNFANETEAGRYFRMDPMELYRWELRAEKEGKRIVGFYHSHPNAPAEFSAEDESFFIPGMIYVIVSVNQKCVGDVRAFLRTLPDEEIKEIEMNLEVEV